MNLIEEFESTGEWKNLLSDQVGNLSKIQSYIDKREAENEVFPLAGMRLEALRRVSPNNIKCVCVGQDPYILKEEGIPQAMGLAFSVLPGLKRPRSLTSIYRELDSCFGFEMRPHGDISSWSRSGVLLLNSVMTVDAGISNSHKGKGWEEFTRKILCEINKLDKPIVYLSWGTFSHKLLSSIDNPKHLVIKTSHPSPLGARKSGKGFESFIGSKCFLKANCFLESRGVEKIDWTSIEK